FAENAAQRDFAAQDQLDVALEQMLTTGAVNRELAAMTQPLMAAVRDGVSPSELMGQLAELYPQMDADGLTERLARVMFVAKIMGRLHANAE
ncbi:DUF935 family protein, partial [Salmonella enterica subsp. enterica]|nr:DUF935 family protein [Salmonella enterica subsp. enterica]